VRQCCSCLWLDIWGLNIRKSPVMKRKQYLAQSFFEFLGRLEAIVCSFDFARISF
jgi:hypothetical protein